MDGDRGAFETWCAKQIQPVGYWAIWQAALTHSRASGDARGEAADWQLSQLFDAVHVHGEFGRGFREEARAILGAAADESLSTHPPAPVAAGEVTIYPGEHPTNPGGWNIHMKGHGCVAQMPGMTANPEARAAQERYRDLIIAALASPAKPPVAPRGEA